MMIDRTPPRVCPARGAFGQIRRYKLIAFARSITALVAIVAATASGAQSCGAANPNNTNQFNGPPGVYDCELDISAPRNFHGNVAYYVRNYCASPEDVPSVQKLSLWVESRTGMFDDWRQLGRVRKLEGRPEFPGGNSGLIVGGPCTPGTEVRLAWLVLGSNAKGDFGPITRNKSADPAPC